MKVKIEAVCSSIVNFAMQQNHVPMIRKLIISNLCEEDLYNIKIDILSKPDFTIPYNKTLNVLPKEQMLDVGVVDIQLSTELLANLTERLAGTLEIMVTQDGELVHKETLKVDVLAYDEWSGYTVLPEMVSAFVTPNHPVLARIVKQASQLLGKWSGSPSFDAYQTHDINRVKMQVAALYTALQAENITYCVPPASFETAGQRIRLCDTVLTQKLGTCLDLTLLLASCLEAVGLHPLIILIKGHAFLGVWLTEECFSEGVQDDLSLLTKRTAEGINDICVVEATALVTGKNTSFDEATVIAKSYLEKEKDFICLVDVKRTRASGIRPLPMRIKSANGWEIAEEVSGQNCIANAPEKVEVFDKIVNVSSIPMTRQKQWERKLLDLSLRNTLLNFRPTKNTIAILASDLGDLEDALASGDEFQVLEKPSDWERSLRDIKVFETRNHLAPLQELLRFEFKQNRLRTPLTECELADCITNLYRSSKLSLEESGSNTLYLALGFLKWYETEVSQKPRYAPLVLIPVEIIRKSAKKGFVIRSRDEDSQMNITLLEMLKQDFGHDIGGLDPLPKDEKGIDLKRVFNIIRQAVMQKSRWDVSEEAYLGIFSFSQFIMWNDIRNRAECLAKNKVVASLMSGKLEWTPEEIAAGNVLLDEVYSPESVALPISADASQLNAICAASEEKSFVLHGPPGTGKSQTITNIIANALFKGKTVLFVAEKMAALSVVQKRLESIGLGPFCLELHSNKSKKKAVLDQLKTATEVVKTIPPEAYGSNARRLAEIRTQINEYVKALHKKWNFGLSLYDAMVQSTDLKKENESVQIEPSTFENMTQEKLAMWMDTANELAVAGKGCQHPFEHPLKEVANISYTQTIKSRAASQLPILLNYLSSCEELFNVLQAVMGQEIPANIVEKVNLLKDIAEGIQNTQFLHLPMLHVDDIDTVIGALRVTSEHGVKQKELQRELLSVYQESVLEFDAQLVLSEWKRLELQWFLPKYLGQAKILKILRRMAIDAKAIRKENVEQQLNSMIHYTNEKKLVENALPAIITLINFFTKGNEIEWESVSKACDFTLELNRQLNALYDSSQKAKAARKSIADYFGTSQDGKEIFIQYVNEYLKLKDKVEEASGLLNINFNVMASKGENWFAYAAGRTKMWIQNLEQLREWCSWLITRRKALDAGLYSLVEAYEQGKLKNEEVIPAFNRGIYKACVEYIISKEPVMNSFSGTLFEEKIKQFKQANEQFEKLTQEEIFARLASKLPSFVQEASQSSEIGILQRAIKSNARAISIRKLFEQIPNLLPRLCPCMLMSPISVAQYVDPQNAPFDLVVFDEASQMPTAEAVGAMARGKNVIVVGDPKQLPPTSFFSTNTVDEDNFETEDLESILDDCLALSMPETHLLWHYRSKHESLIAFSNIQYYDNKLLTFPSPNDLTSKVKLCMVDGFYDRGKTKHNKAEAKAVVDEIIRRLHDPELKNYSIGVVTFSSVQQNLIDDMLTEIFKENPELEDIAYNSPEPIFIKNLENVQGDERDIILFSIGYGPDENGKVSLNFGPLNREGGWRRLNVVVSRARHEMLVFSSLKPEQLDITRTSSQGIAGIKAFLEYAQKGKQGMAVKASQVHQKHIGLGEHIAKALEESGYTAHSNVGCSGYKIDVAVVHPNKPGEYILGILCDGHTYKDAKTANDRELLQQNVLKQLGWNVHKVWSMDWWDNPAKEISKIQQQIEKLLKEPEHKQDAGKGKLMDIPRKEEVPPTAQNLFAGIPVQPVNHLQKTYVAAQLPLESMSADEFCMPESTMKIMNKIHAVVEVEGPINRSLLCKRVLQSCGIARAGARIERRLDELFAKMEFAVVTNKKNQYIWKREQSPKEYSIYRVAGNEADRRLPEELPPEEIACAVKFVLENQISLPKSELIKETCKVLGYQRSGSALEIAVESGIEVAVKWNWAALSENDRVVLK